MWRRLSMGLIGAAWAVPAIIACSVDYLIWSKSKTSDTPLFRIVTSDDFGTGYIDSKGRIAIRPQYDDYGNYGNEFHEGVAEVRSAKREIFSIDSRNRRLRQFDGLDMQPFSEGLAAAKRQDKYGYVDHNGKFLIPEQFDWANPFHDGLASVEVGNRQAYITRTGAWLTTQRFGLADDFHDGVAWVIEKENCATDGLCGLYTVGDFRTPPSVLPRCRYSLINTKGEIVAREAYLDVKPFSEGLAPVSDGNLWGFSDRNGRLVIPIQYYGAEPFSEGVAGVCTTATTCGYIDHTGKVVIPATYYGTRSFSEGYAVIKLETGRYSYIDRTGKVVIKGPFAIPSDFVKGLAHVSWTDENDIQHWSYIDRTGRTVFTYTRRQAGRP